MKSAASFRPAGALLLASALASLIAGTSAWVCAPGHHTPVILLKDDPACMSLDGKACVWFATREECLREAATPRSNIRGLICGDRMKDVWGNDGYAPGSWCSVAREHLLSLQSPSSGASLQHLAPRAGHKFQYGVALDFGNDSPAAYVGRVGFVPTVWTTFERISDWFNAGNPTGVAWALAGLGQPWGSLTVNMVLMSDCGLGCIGDNGIAQVAVATRQMNALGVRVLVIPLPEPQGYWFSFGNQPGSYQDVFRRIVWGMRAAGIDGEMTKFGWQNNDASTYPYGQTRFDPRLDTNGNGYLDRGDDPWTPYYPGDDVVDWIGISAYHYGNSWPWNKNEVPFPGKLLGIATNSAGENGGAGSGFDLHAFAAARGKKFAIFETAAAYFTGSDPGAGRWNIQTNWWHQVYGGDTLDRLWNLGMVVWFEVLKEEEGNVRDFRATRDLGDTITHTIDMNLVARPGELHI